MTNVTTTEYFVVVYSSTQEFFTTFDTTDVSNEFDTAFGKSASGAMSILIFLFVLIVSLICSYWSITFWRHRHMRAYKHSLKVRRPIWMLISYAIIIPFLLERSIAMIYLYFLNNIELNTQNKPIIYSYNTDMTMHFLFWLAFWSFLYLKCFKLFMMRYDYAYSMEMSNVEWRDHLGLRTIEPTSFMIRYRSIVGNDFLMFSLALVLMVLVVSTQIFIRLIPSMSENSSSVTIEQIVNIIIASFDFIFMTWMMNKIRSIDDNFYLRTEISHEFWVTLIGIICWIIGLIIYSMTEDYISVLFGILVYTTWLVTFCYYETIYILKRIDYEWVKQRQVQHAQYHYNANEDGQVQQIELQYILKLNDILKCQAGFEAMMRFLVKEFSCENLLCYVEMSQYIQAWTTMGIKRRRCKKLVHGDLRECCAEYSLYIPQDIVAMITKYYLKLYAKDEYYEHAMDGFNRHEIEEYPYQHGHHYRNDINIDMYGNPAKTELFPYFEEPEFEDDMEHFEYLMQKYIYDSACLQINISGGLRAMASGQDITPGADLEYYIKMVNTIRDELWSLMRDSFTRFRGTQDYKKLVVSRVFLEKQSCNITTK